MTDIATREPEQLVIGDRWLWERQDLADYPASTWTLSYALVNAAGKVTITAAANGTFHRVDVAAAVTALYGHGTYRWQAYVTSGSDRRMVGSGTVLVKPNFAGASALDARGHARRVLDAIEAVIEGRATKDQMGLSINNRSLQRTPIADLLLLRDRYKAMATAEEVGDKLASGLGGARRLMVRL